MKSLLITLLIITLLNCQGQLHAQNSSAATPGTGGPLRPLKAGGENGAEDPGILAGERRTQFDRLDADKNGRLSPEEFAQVRALSRRTGSGIGTAGMNRSQAEADPLVPAGDVASLFTQLDHDKDGVLTYEEFATMPVTKASSPAPQIDNGAADISRTTGATAGKVSLGKQDRSALFFKLDKNKDGNLDAEEFSKMTVEELSSEKPAAVFHRLDVDSNGTISKEEFSKLPASAPPLPSAR